MGGKAYRESAKNGVTSVLLIPARTDTAYFHEYIYGRQEIRFLRGRLRFTDEDGNYMLDRKGLPTNAPFPSMVVIFHAKTKRSGE